jgi:hypothetical protein
LSTTKRSTDNVDQPRFRPHGRVEYEERGNVLYSVATGPFNTELMEALLELAKATFPVMAAKGKWANIATFQESALCSAQVLAGLQDALGQMVQLQIAAEATAFVLPPEVEGAAIMAPLYARCFAAANLKFIVVENLSAAEYWASQQLQA